MGHTIMYRVLRSPGKSSALARHLILERQPALVTYGFTLLLLAGFILLREVLMQDLGGRLFLLLVAPVFFSSLLFGPRAGLVATALGSAAGVWLLADPHEFRIGDPEELIGATIFLGMCFGIVAVTAMLRRAMKETASDAAERELLLREITHRVRNDLQAVVSMLYLAFSGRSDFIESIEPLVQRIKVMSKVYDRLALQNAATVVDARDFLEALVLDLRGGLVGPRPIAITTSLEDIVMDARNATALGLVVNEAVTNAVKYAFPDGRKGRIEIKLWREGITVNLTVRDDGIGCESDAVSQGTRTGLRLIEHILAQNGGALTYASSDGTSVQATIPDPVAGPG
jgi:two-component sensor histidine kinase